MWRAQQHRLEPSGKVMFMQSIMPSKTGQMPASGTLHFQTCWLLILLDYVMSPQQSAIASTGMPKLLLHIVAFCTAAINCLCIAGQMQHQAVACILLDSTGIGTTVTHELRKLGGRLGRMHRRQAPGKTGFPKERSSSTIRCHAESQRVHGKAVLEGCFCMWTLICHDACLGSTWW